MRAQQRQHAVHSVRKVKPIVSSHKKGTAPSQTDCCVISQERDRSFKKKQTAVSFHKKGTAPQNRQRPQSKLSQQITKCEHLVTTCGMALQLEIVMARSSVSPQAWSSSALKGFSNIFLLPWKLDPFCTMGDDPREARSCSSEFCP